MRILKKFSLVPLMFILLVTVAVARDYGRSGGSAGTFSSPGMTQQQQQPMGQAQTTNQYLSQYGQIFFTGSLTSIDLNRQELLVNTQVPGLLGPQNRDIPVKVTEDTTMSICFKSMNWCDSVPVGRDGLQLVSALENFTNLSSVRKNVIVVGEPDSGRIVHVQVEYDV